MDNEKYLPELMAEKDSLDPSFQHSLRLLDQGTSGCHGGRYSDDFYRQISAETTRVWREDVSVAIRAKSRGYDQRSG
ncbi:hypothetical protein QQF64_013170 [Cirrhinus molitorella]|uniref:KHDRBS Qua1 domain-containing protein n=1 Tax=Cirrhinus molitorella TaxID=172907 RepID=A0ABR3LQC8_9TELE